MGPFPRSRGAHAKFFSCKRFTISLIRIRIRMHSKKNCRGSCFEAVLLFLNQNSETLLRTFFEPSGPSQTAPADLTFGLQSVDLRTSPSMDIEACKNLSIAGAYMAGGGVRKEGKRVTAGWEYARSPDPPNYCVLKAATPVPLSSENPRFGRSGNSQTELHTGTSFLSFDFQFTCNHHDSANFSRHVGHFSGRKR